MGSSSKAENDDEGPPGGTRELLRESRDEFGAIFDNAPTGMCLTGLDGRFLAVNPAMCRTLGYQESELLGLRFGDFTHPDDAALSGSWARRMIDDPTAPDAAFEKRYLHKGGQVVWAVVSVHLLRDPAGGPRCFLTQVQDVTERRHAEEALRESEEKFRIAFDNAPTGMAIVLPDGKYTAVNGALCRMLGYSARELLEGTIHRVTHPEDVARSDRWIRRVISGDLSEPELEKRYLHRDGHVVWGVVRATWVRSAAGQALFSVAHVEDVTRRKQAEEERMLLQAQLHQAQKMEAIGLLAGGVAHDFNNLLTAIGGNASLALEDLRREDPLHGLLSDIGQAVEAASRLTRQLLAFSRKQVIAPRILDLNEVVARLEGMLRRVLGEDIRLHTTLAPQLGRIRVDPGQIEQILLNLSVNARDAMAGGGRIHIETRDVALDEAQRREHGLAQAAQVLLAVSDEGVGMSEEVQRHLFEPFFTTKGPGKGTGLGLPMVYGAVKQNGGHIEISSRQGEGTTVRVYFPRVEALEATVQARPAVPVAGAARRGRETVLLVEDDTMVRTLASRALGRQGYRVVACSSGEEALGVVRADAGEIALLVTDVVMTGMNGRALAEAVHGLRPDVRVLFSSGYGEHVIARDGVLEPGIEFLPKPYSPEELVQRVGLVLDRVPPRP